MFKSDDSSAVLITGGAGFIGSSLADRLLAAGRKVIAVDNFSPYYDVRIKEQNVSGHKNNPSYKLY
ncbi:MAG: GDP-mannose 4,6-dehydratase, partial [Elusimicrobiales bacterium]|nr:GDP-mannose 4,6-dehydratase [Elusimicrobiales bacterium]